MSIFAGRELRAETSDAGSAAQISNHIDSRCGLQLVACSSKVGTALAQNNGIPDKESTVDSAMTRSNPIIIIKTGSTYPQISAHYGDFDTWISHGLGQSSSLMVVDAPRGDALPTASEIAGVVVTGSHAMVTEQAPWMRKLTRWLYALVHEHRQVPVLGLCFGHQLLAQALGGEVADNPLGMEVGTVALRLTQAGRQDALLSAISGHPWAQVVHRQSVLTPPPGATVLASNVHDACQAFRYGERIWGVQFHPEFSADVMRAYLQALSGDTLTQQQVDHHLPEVRECTGASSILGRFAQLTAAQVA